MVSVLAVEVRWVTAVLAQAVRLQSYETPLAASWSLMMRCPVD
jgi:hypothetical protein